MLLVRGLPGLKEVVHSMGLQPPREQVLHAHGDGGVHKRSEEARAHYNRIMHTRRVHCNHAVGNAHKRCSGGTVVHVGMCTLAVDLARCK